MNDLDKTKTVKWILPQYISEDRIQFGSDVSENNTNKLTDKPTKRTE